MHTVKTINGEVQPGDWVIAAGNNDYRYLIGTVTEINKPGTPEHNTNSDLDDIHVDFTAFNYPSERIAEIEEHFYNLLNEPKYFRQLPLSDVIMAPQMLISITQLGQDEIERMGNSRTKCEAFCNHFPTAIDPYNRKHAAFIERIEKNLDDYHASLMGFSKRELIEMADKISAMSDAYSYLCFRSFDDEELDFFLNFQNPLEVVAEGWRGYHADINDEMGFSLDNILSHKQDWLDSYPQTRDSEEPADPGLRRFMGVNLIEFLGKIADKVIVYYPGDFKINIDTLYRMADSENPDDKRLMWHVSSYGTHMNTERETYIKDTGAYNTWVNYRPNDPDMFGYIIEITGRNGHVVTGNVFEVGDYANHARYVRETALILDLVSLTYSPNWGVNAGKTINVPRFEYDDDRHRLMSESGDVVAIHYQPHESIRTMPDLLRQERSRRMSYPIGSQQAHIKLLSEKLAEIRKPPEKAVQHTAPGKKRSIMAQLEEADAEARAYNAQQARNKVNTTKKSRQEID